MDGLIRLTVWFSGHVQGVGFRYTTVGVARRFRVTGYVRNLSDGRVEMVAEGEADQVRDFAAAVESEMSGYVGKMQSNESPPTGEYAEFGVRH